MKWAIAILGLTACSTAWAVVFWNAPHTPAQWSSLLFTSILYGLTLLLAIVAVLGIFRSAGAGFVKLTAAEKFGALLMLGLVLLFLFTKASPDDGSETNPDDAFQSQLGRH